MESFGVRISNVVYWLCYLLSLCIAFVLELGVLGRLKGENNPDNFIIFILVCLIIFLNAFWVILQYLCTGSIRIIAPELSKKILGVVLICGLAAAAYNTQLKNKNAEYQAQER